MSWGQFDDEGGRGFELFATAASGSAREEQQTGLRSRGTKSGGRGGLLSLSFGRASGGMPKSSSSSTPGLGYYSSSDSIPASKAPHQQRPRISHRSSLPASPSASSFRFSFEEEEDRPSHHHQNHHHYKEHHSSPNSNHYHHNYSPSSSSQSQTPPTSWTPRTSIPRHHLDRLVQNSSSLSLPSSLARTHRSSANDDNDERASIISTTSTTRRRYSIDSPVEEVSVLPRSPTLEYSSGVNLLSEEDVAARRLRKIRLQKIHHLMGGEVPADQLVDGPGTGPWLEPSSTHHHSNQPHRSLSTSKLNGLDGGAWKAKVGRVKEKASEMKPSFSGGSSRTKGAGGGKGRSRSNSKNYKSDDGGGGGGAAGETSFLRLEAGELPEAAGGGGGTSKRGLKLNKLFGDTPSPNLYHHTHPSKVVSVTSPSRSLFGSISNGNSSHRSSSSSGNSGSTGGSGGSGGRENRVSVASGDASLDFLRA
ncbi:hypothetical protein BDY24DRAFT_387045 [Mrakia frigida]|uniref:uncharacterized protein n=1 Tax=Mrakia frigida TaxID=29902 RepID=UPI003FCC0AE0